MRYGTNWIVAAVIAGLVALTLPEASLAVCYRCDENEECADACNGSGGKNQCAFRRACGSNGACVSYDCELAGTNCTGTAECAACSQALEECGIENAGASLFVPNGAVPAGRPWLELKQQNLRVCQSAVEPPRPPEVANTAADVSSTHRPVVAF